MRIVAFKWSIFGARQHSVANCLAKVLFPEPELPKTITLIGAFWLVRLSREQANLLLAQPTEPEKEKNNSDFFQNALASDIGNPQFICGQMLM